jgi:two-component system, OmpR family, phosphate regulon sensor histidine kinase PhoR
MRPLPDLQNLIEALDEPALLVRRGRVDLHNSAVTRVLGRSVQGGDVRLAIRHPLALQRILAQENSDVEVSGIGPAEKPWLLTVRTIGRDTVLVRLVDRSAARAAEKMRVDFVANASHELRTPLSTIIGYAETLAEPGELDPEAVAQFGGVIGSEAKRMLRIVTDLMSLSRIEADRFVAPRERVVLADLAQIVAEQGRELLKQRECTITVEADPEGTAVAGDFAQLLQMADNLVSNAIRYGCTEAGGEVRIAVRRKGPSVSLSVSDQGDGIPAEHLPRLTERFYRVDEARSRNSGGTGLGLAIVKHVVERHRGTISISSEPGRGTTVTVQLPAA